jgi:hypothetical protein
MVFSSIANMGFLSGRRHDPAELITGRLNTSRKAEMAEMAGQWSGIGIGLKARRTQVLARPVFWQAAYCLRKVFRIGEKSPAPAVPN